MKPRLFPLSLAPVPTFEYEFFCKDLRLLFMTLMKLYFVFAAEGRFFLSVPPFICTCAGACMAPFSGKRYFLLRGSQAPTFFLLDACASTRQRRNL